MFRLNFPPTPRMFQVCFPPFLLREEAQAEAGEPLTECGCHGQTALVGVETHDSRAEEAVRRDGGARQAEVSEVCGVRWIP